MKGASKPDKKTEQPKKAEASKKPEPSKKKAEATKEPEFVFTIPPPEDEGDLKFKVKS